MSVENMMSLAEYDDINALLLSCTLFCKSIQMKINDAGLSLHLCVAFSPTTRIFPIDWLEINNSSNCI